MEIDAPQAWTIRCRQLPDRPRVTLMDINPLNAKLNPIYHLLALLGAHNILHVSRIRVKHYDDDVVYDTGNRTRSFRVSEVSTFSVRSPTFNRSIQVHK